MTTPFGFRAESIRTPKASRAGALYGTELHSTGRQIACVAIPSYEGATCEAPAFAPDRANRQCEAGR